VAVDLGELFLREIELVEGSDVRLELLDARRPDERRRHARISERPSERHLRERLSA
jgi:hypothetical protein